jgi:hypothetical protein
VKTLRIAVPPKARGLDFSEEVFASPIEPEVIEFERSADGFLRCAECKGDIGISEDTPTDLILKWHLDEHRETQQQKQILEILQDAHRRIALIKGENK